MSRYERDQFFEALCVMRHAYATLADDDSRSSLLVGDAVLYAEAVMQALDAEEIAADIEATAATATEPMTTSDPRD